MQAKIEKIGGVDHLTISLPIQRQQSKSGKSLLVASSGGIKATTVQVDGKPVQVGLNAFIK